MSLFQRISQIGVLISGIRIESLIGVLVSGVRIEGSSSHYGCVLILSE